jgi:hypothetical protein
MSNELKERLKGVKTVFIQHMDTSKSGMTRWYSVYIATTKDSICNISWIVARECDLSFSDTRYGIKVNGCGFSGEHQICEDIKSVTGLKKLRYERL